MRVASKSGPILHEIMITMKALIASFLTGVSVFALSGCFSYESRAGRTVVVDTAPVGVRETVVTTLPAGYRSRVYRGTTYYYHNNVYYRARPDGYVVVTRPW